jgi:DNA-binding NarL/FixJ family response regulator
VSGVPLPPLYRRVLAGLARGRSNVEIATDLGVSVNRVRSTLDQLGARAGTSFRSGIVGWAYRTGQLTGLAPEPRPGLRLSPARLQVLDGMARGLTDEQIAAVRWVSVNTVKAQGKEVFAALGVRCRAHAVAIGYQHGLLGLSVAGEAAA